MRYHVEMLVRDDETKKERPMTSDIEAPDELSARRLVIERAQNMGVHVRWFLAMQVKSPNPRRNI
jgi:hypothetical protein